jgi:hypothetical protein
MQVVEADVIYHRHLYGVVEVYIQKNYVSDAFLLGDISKK